MKRDEFLPILVSELNKLTPLVSAAFHGSVDYNKMWDGTVKADEFRINSTNFYTPNNYGNEFVKQLTMGSFVVTFYTDAGGDVRMISFKYQISQITDHNQPLYKNSIERSCWDKAKFTDENGIRKLISSKLKSLLEAVPKWFHGTHLSPYRYSEYVKLNKSTSPITSSDVYFGSMMGAAGRLRLNAELYAQRCEFYQLPGTGGKRLIELANLFMAEMRKELDNAPALANTSFYEGY
jgi:hypothetical protein